MVYYDETESETRTNRMLPVMQATGWGVVEGSRIREEMIYPGRVSTKIERRSKVSRLDQI